MPNASKTSENWVSGTGCASSNVVASFCFTSLKAGYHSAKSAHFSFSYYVTGQKKETGDPHSVG